VRFGAHLSIAGGVSKALLRGKEAGCDAIQIFLRPNLNWRLPPLSEDEVRRFRKLQKQADIWPVVGHASYLINLAAADEAHYRRSIGAMVTELERAESLGVKAVSVHPGSHKGLGEKKGLARIAKGLDAAFRRAKGARAMVLLETTAGMGSALGHTFEQLAEIISLSRFPQRLGVCLDTCHVFAAGYDIRTPDAYSKTMSELSKTVGLAKVKVVHANDSKEGLGSRLDRHEHIGEGKIGLQGFRNVVNDPRLAEVPVILETPKQRDKKRGEEDGNGSMDRENLRRLRSLVLKLG